MYSEYASETFQPKHIVRVAHTYDKFTHICLSYYPELNMWRRFFSDSKSYTKTVNLPKTKFPARIKPKERQIVQNKLNQVSNRIPEDFFGAPGWL